MILCHPRISTGSRGDNLTIKNERCYRGQEFSDCNQTWNPAPIIDRVIWPGAPSCGCKQRDL